MTNLLIQSGNQVYIPVVKDDVQWVTHRQGTPGELNFSVLNDDKLKINEGDSVRFQYKGKNVFYGYIFEKSEDKNSIIDIIAYDQLRYLKNKDTYVYSNKRADQVIKMISNDFGLSTGVIENSKYTIPSRVEDNTSLFDMINNALDLTLENTGEQFVLFDDFGKISLKRMQSMAVGVLVTADTAEDYKYVSSIDDNTYNRIKLSRENEKKGTREIFISQDSKTIGQWGVLQYFDTVNEGVNGKTKANNLLKLYNEKTKTLEIKNQLGDVDVRGGSMVAVGLQLSDTRVSNMMVVEECTHRFSKGSHLMDFKLWGGEFSE